MLENFYEFTKLQKTRIFHRTYPWLRQHNGVKTYIDRTIGFINKLKGKHLTNTSDYGRLPLYSLI